MLKNKDKEYIKKRKKIWDHFGWVYKSANALNKNHSLNCGCRICYFKTYYKRISRKRNRIKNRVELKNKLKELN